MSEKALVLYDGDCRFCVSSVGRLRSLDWLGRLSYASARDPEALRAHPQVDAHRALARLQLVPPGGGAVLEGFGAFRWMAARLPAFWILWPLMWIPGATWVGTRIYDWFARNRFGFGTCPDGACAIEPVPGERETSGAER